jgi:hypothetical protein
MISASQFHDSIASSCPTMMCHLLPLLSAVLLPAVHLSQADFRKAKEKVLYKKKEGVPEGLYM